MTLRRFRFMLLVVGLTVLLQARAGAQVKPEVENMVEKWTAFLPVDHSRPMTVSELCCRLDSLNDEIRSDGLIVVKQPDVFSQARLTRFRNDVDQQMSADLANFHLVLAARINRLDSATTTSTTALGAALSAPGTSSVQAPAANAQTLLTGMNAMYSGSPSLLGSAAPHSAFGTLGPATNNFGPMTSATASTALGLGVEPTVYLDEKKRFLDHLNQIRRINMGPDQNDSSGYGLYLVRLPVSITPGHGTSQGYGADLSLTVEHEFSRDFLPATFQNLVINDVVDQVGPVVYELIRSGELDKLKAKIEFRRSLPMKQRWLAEENSRLLESRREDFGLRFVQLVKAKSASGPPTRVTEPYYSIAEPIADYVLRTGKVLENNPDHERLNRNRVADRLAILYQASTKGLGISGIARQTQEMTDANTVAGVRNGSTRIDSEFEQITKERSLNLVYQVMRNSVNELPAALPEAVRRNSQEATTAILSLVSDLYITALPDDIGILNGLLGLTVAEQRGTARIAENNAESNRYELETIASRITLPAVRSAKQSYPISPREMIDFLLEENIYLLANDVCEASRVKTIRLLDVRNYLRQSLETAYYAMAFSTGKASGVTPPLADVKFMEGVLDLVHERQFGAAGAGDPSPLSRMNKLLIQQLEPSRDNIRNKPIGALCWAIAVDAALLDFALRKDAERIFKAEGVPCEPLEAVRFFLPRGVENEDGNSAFCEYVKRRWPIVTFAIDPVNEEQNIADSFSLNRDLQLAVSFAFASGQINFSQLNTFRRQIQQSADAIALNRTVTGYVHGQESFGFRFTPRYQNPPNQRTNFQVIASQLIGGGPGPDYQIKKSKLEPGMRELTAILLLPTFLPTMRMEISGNWFKLTDADRLVFHTNRMMERGRRVAELREAASYACGTKAYRDSDLRVLKAKLAQLEAILPMQSRVIPLPYENSANGFDLLSEGSTALVPELTGFSGVDVIPASGSGGAAGAGTTPPATFSMTTLTSPPTTTNYTIAGGTTSIADVFVFGKYINLLDTRVTAGGRSASFEVLSREVVHVQIPSNVIPTTTEDGKNYVEIYLATPNGISNSLLIPYGPVTPTVELAYRLPAGNPPVDVDYQWLAGADGKTSLVATAKPDGGNGVKISWDSGIGLAPRQIQAQFVATINGQNLSMVFQADASNKDDYNIDGQKFMATLLHLLQEVTVYPSLPPSSITFTVNVQPWIPNDSGGLRARSNPKPLAQKLIVNMRYNATGTNAMPDVAPVIPQKSSDQPGASGMSRGLSTPATSGRTEMAAIRMPSGDPEVVRTAQRVTPRSSSLLNVPQQPPAMTAPSLLAPNISTEAEQVSRILTGQPIATTVSTGPSGTAEKLATSGNGAYSGTGPQAGTPTIVVNPSPVMLLPSTKPPDNKKRKSRIGQMISRIGNRMSE